MVVKEDTNILHEAQSYVRDMVQDIVKNYNSSKEFGYYNVYINFSNRLTRRLGYCRTYKYRSNADVYFSNMFIKDCWNKGDKEAIKELVIHEVAHALCNDIYGFGHGHDNYFREVVIRLGGNLTSAKSNIGTAYKPYRYIYKCPNCGKEFKSKKVRKGACAKCCNEFNNGEYTDKYKWVLVEDKGRIDNWE